MKEYIKPNIEIIDIKVKDDIATNPGPNPTPSYTTDGDTITYWVMNLASLL